ncbi:hypothetical protein H671_xg20389 [Cricetulus griseus]|uniref:Uncharacterized protein n=1 Tax=Cricetulus griseus TaxID=10029 RepID=A0A061HUH8_CRIGR|nr:hypothetical protein H671_xg20389 [Cricetulus griseus]
MWSILEKIPCGAEKKVPSVFKVEMHKTPFKDDRIDILWDWRDGSVFKSTGYFCRGPEISLQHPHQETHTYLLVQLSVLIREASLFSGEKLMQKLTSSRCAEDVFLISS